MASPWPLAPIPVLLVAWWVEKRRHLGRAPRYREPEPESF